MLDNHKEVSGVDSLERKKTQRGYWKQSKYKATAFCPKE